ncbi:MAG: flagellar hook assembly protein FlgD [Parvularculaceae bacterium]
MEIPAITNGLGAADTATSGLAEDFDTFLLLLTEQLKNQDPLSPLDTNEFTAQIVQFTSVEQQIAQNRNLEALIALQANADAANAVDYIGRRATIAGAENQLTEAGAEWTYALPQSAQETSLQVVDASGAVIFTASGETSPGAHAFVWDGATLSGQPAPPGVYSLRVAAADAEGADLEAEISIRAVIDRVEFGPEGPRLAFGALTAKLSDVKAVEAL